MVVESPPIGIEPLPTDSRHVGEIDSAFVYSYDWGVLQQKVNLKDVGLTKEILRTIMPFQFVATQVYVWSIDVSFPFISKSNETLRIVIFRIGTRWDCGGCFCVILCLLNKKGEAISINMSDNIILGGENWFESTCTLNVVQEFERFNEIESLAILVCGKDTQYWAGQYGTKCSRISVNLKCLSQTEAESVTPHIKQVTNPQNAHLFIGNFWHSLLPNRPMGRCPYRVQRN